MATNDASLLQRYDAAYGQLVSSRWQPGTTEADPAATPAGDAATQLATAAARLAIAADSRRSRESRPGRHRRMVRALLERLDQSDPETVHRATEPVSYLEQVVDAQLGEGTRGSQLWRQAVGDEAHDVFALRPLSDHVFAAAEAAGTNRGTATAIAVILGSRMRHEGAAALLSMASELDALAGSSTTITRAKLEAILAPEGHLDAQQLATALSTLERTLTDRRVRTFGRGRDVATCLEAVAFLRTSEVPEGEGHIKSFRTEVLRDVLRGDIEAAMRTVHETVSRNPTWFPRATRAAVGVAIDDYTVEMSPAALRAAESASKGARKAGSTASDVAWLSTHLGQVWFDAASRTIVAIEDVFPVGNDRHVQLSERRVPTDFDPAAPIGSLRAWEDASTTSRTDARGLRERVADLVPLLDERSLAGMGTTSFDDRDRVRILAALHSQGTVPLDAERVQTEIAHELERRTDDDLRSGGARALTSRSRPGTARRRTTTGAAELPDSRSELARKLHQHVLIGSDEHGPWVGVLVARRSYNRSTFAITLHKARRLGDIAGTEGAETGIPRTVALWTEAVDIPTGDRRLIHELQAGSTQDLGRLDEVHGASYTAGTRYTVQDGAGQTSTFHGSTLPDDAAAVLAQQPRITVARQGTSGWRRPTDPGGTGRRPGLQL